MTEYQPPAVTTQDEAIAAITEIAERFDLAVCAATVRDALISSGITMAENQEPTPEQTRRVLGSREWLEFGDTSYLSRFGNAYYGSDPANRANEIDDAVREIEIYSGFQSVRLIKHLMPEADPNTDLITDISIAQLRKAVQRKIVRSGWVRLALARWIGHKTLVNETTSAAVLVALSHLVHHRPATAAEAVKVIDDAVSRCVTARAYHGQGAPEMWWTAMIGGEAVLHEEVIARIDELWSMSDSSAVVSA